MKVIYRTVFKYMVNDLCGYETSNRWHYGELPTTKITHFTIDELKKTPYNFFVEKRLFSKKYKVCPYYSDNGWVKEEDFIDASITLEYKIVDWQYSIRDLMEKLCADEFMNWRRDNGLLLYPSF